MQRIAILVLLASCAPIEPPPSDADSEQLGVFNGTDASAYADEVYRVGSATTYNGTGWVARYPRCVVSADHVPGDRVWRNASETQLFAGAPLSRGWFHSPPASADPAVEYYADFTVGWTQAKTASDNYDPYAATPFNIASVPGGIPIVDPTTPTTLLPGAPSSGVAVDVIGWGESHLGGAHEDLLQSTFTAYQLRNGTEISSGEDFGGWLVYGTFYDRATCGGDSGGPVVGPSGDVIGVHTNGNGQPCANTPHLLEFHRVGGAAAFNTVANAPDLSNYDWIDQTIEETCGKPLHVTIQGEGHVVGSRMGPDVRAMTTAFDSIDALIDCDPTNSLNNCLEIVHYDEEMDLTATEGYGYLFEEWSNGPGSDCPCDGDTSTSCTFEYDDMGEYGISVSQDQAICVAVFECDPSIDADGDGVPYCDDCDDDDPTLQYADVEVCDGIDNDCDGLVDEDGDEWLYVDADGDSYGDPATGDFYCPQLGYVSNDDDCDDTDENVFPEATEYCNEIDDDCDEEVDENEPQPPADATQYWVDNDGDGWENDDESIYRCEWPLGYALVFGDCDDANAEVAPDATEICDGIDNDCDSEIDEDVIEGIPIYPDADGDGFGDLGYEEYACAAPEGWVTSGDDCDDNNPEARPGGLEFCDGYDTDCDFEADPPPCTPQQFDTTTDLTLHCGETAVTAPPDGAMVEFFAPKPLGSIFAFTVDGYVSWCAWNDFAQAGDWGDTTLWTADYGLSEGVDGAYCDGELAGWDLECPDT